MSKEITKCMVCGKEEELFYCPRCNDLCCENCIDPFSQECVECVKELQEQEEE